MTKETLITGGFGFLGTHLVEELLNENPEAEIHIVDNLSTNSVDPDKFLDSLDNPGSVTHTDCSVKSYLLSHEESFSEVYHLASIVGPAGVLPHAGKIAPSIIADTAFLAKRSQDWGARLLDVSTSEVYGGGQEGLCEENMDKIIQADNTVRLEYAIGKLAAETSLLNLTKAGELDTVIIRPFNIVGPRQSGEGGFVLPRFVQSALKGEPLTVFGDGQQIRAFTHVKDVVRGIRLAMGQGKSGEVYNMGNEANKTTVQNLAELVVALTGSDSEIEYTDPKTIYGSNYAEANDKYPDSTKANRELGWTPDYCLHATVADTVLYERGQI